MNVAVNFRDVNVKDGTFVIVITNVEWAKYEGMSDLRTFGMMKTLLINSIQRVPLEGPAGIACILFVQISDAAWVSTEANRLSRVCVTG